MTITSSLFKLTLLLLLVSCAQTDNKTNEDETLVDSQGWFRGYTLGENVEDILRKEAWQPRISNDSIIEFRQSLVYNQDSIELDLYLSFDQLGLFEIQADFWIDNSVQSKNLMANFTEKLSSTFGDHKTSGDEKVWTTNSETNSIIEITLAEEFTTEEVKFLSLNYLEPLNDKY